MDNKLSTPFNNSEKAKTFSTIFVDKFTTPAFGAQFFVKNLNQEIPSINLAGKIQMYTKTQAQFDALRDAIGIIIEQSQDKQAISDSLVHLSKSGPSNLLPPEYAAEYRNTLNQLIRF